MLYNQCEFFPDYFKICYQLSQFYITPEEIVYLLFTSHGTIAYMNIPTYLLAQNVCGSCLSTPNLKAISNVIIVFSTLFLNMKISKLFRDQRDICDTSTLFLILFRYCSVAMPQHVPQSLPNPPCVECLFN